MSGGFRECYTDVDGVLCVESDVRKAFRDAAQADDWLASRRSAAEWRLRTAIPALRALPLLHKLALGEGGVICLDYLPPMQLGVAIQPC